MLEKAYPKPGIAFVVIVTVAPLMIVTGIGAMIGVVIGKKLAHRQKGGKADNN
jgi:hypothetical protein